MNTKGKIVALVVAAIFAIPLAVFFIAFMMFSSASASSCDGVANAPTDAKLTNTELATVKSHWDEITAAAASVKPAIPPEALVGIWYRESDLSANQDLQAGNPIGGPYTASSDAYASYGHPASLQESFLIAAKTLQAKAKTGLFHRSINAAHLDQAVLKDAYFGYNGRAESYARQAQLLGFDPDRQPYEGSPYVMNEYDAKHHAMLIISHDFGGVDSVDSRLGAFTVFSSLYGDGTASIVSSLQCQSSDSVAVSNGWSLPIASGSYTLGVPFGQHGPEWSLGYHTGQDFPAPEGTPIHAVADGVISFASWTDSYGNETDETINDGGEVVHVVYAHAVRRAPGIAAGTKVSAGQVIAYVGETGNAFGYHLHFEYRPGQNDYKQAQDPVPWLRSHGLNP